ncbi:methionyl-tRNA formyltransferase [Bdellovibrio sp. qaytius]|nr:methionyl-tRNA formyltransferase [Bdellovibrio sp. qaytius]
MSVVRVCFLGTPDFAAKHLQTLLNDDHYLIVGVVTQPDRPSGRKMQLTPSPVKELALKNNLPVLTPENLRKEPEVFEQIKSWQAEVAVVVAFGQILSQDFLDSFSFGAVNVHGSLLPKWRGAAPIQRSIEAGDTVTGVCLQRMVKKLDAGPVIGERRVQLDAEINATQLYDRLAVLGCELLHVELMDYVRGNLAPLAQDESLVTVAPKIEKEESLLDFNKSAESLHNKIRAFSMGPGTFINFQGKRLKIHKTKVVDSSSNVKPGQIAVVDAHELLIQTSQGQLSLLEVQPESKNRMVIADFLKSHPLAKGQSFHE